MKKLGLILRIAFLAIFFLAVVFFLVAMRGDSSREEAYIGSFESETFNEGWIITKPDGEIITDVTLPDSFDIPQGDTLVATNTLPDNIHDGMRLGIRSSREEITIKINGEVRSLYSLDSIHSLRKSVVSAYILVDLYDKDAGGTIQFEIISDSGDSVKLNSVNYAYGNNVWFPYIENSIDLIFIAFIMIFIGIFAIVIYFFIKSKVEQGKTVYYLAETIIVSGLWMLSESEIRQMFFRSPSMSNIFSFMFVEIIAAFGMMFCNEVQKYRYNDIYVFLQTVILFQVIINMILNFTGILDFYDTMILSHSWTIVSIIIVGLLLIVDFITKRYRKYIFTSIGLAFLVGSSFMEIVNFYLSMRIASMGFFLGFGFLLLLAFTTIQLVKDMVRSAELRRKASEKSNRVTFQTIASTIDAKDQYTGGHSDRVGEYAKLLCMEVANEYGFNKDDFNNIKYIGRMHDIGKIGVPDRVLNKNGRLTEEEFDKMKNHTVIGYNIIQNIDYIPGLKEGVRSHHERWDGTGYPDGLAGDNISIFARILCLADSYDAMTTDRVYRKKLSRDQVISEITKNRGKQFDPHLADVFLKMIEENKV